VHLQVQLHRGAGGLGRDRVEVGLQVFRRDGVAARRVVTGDVEADRLATGTQHLLVERGVALVGGEGFHHEVAAFEGGQDPDHGELRAAVDGLGAGHGELVEQVALQVAPLVARERARRQVQLEVPAPEFGLEL
jgi:hypothetical protein